MKITPIQFGPVDDTATLWQVLRQAIEDRDLTQKELARAMFRSRNSISMITQRANRGRLPSLAVCAEMARALGLEIHVTIRARRDQRS